MEDSHWDELLAATLDSARVAQASQAFQEFMNSSPDACLVCLEKAANPARAETLRDRSLVLMQKPFEAVQKLPREVSDPICQRALEMIVPMTASATPWWSTTRRWKLLIYSDFHFLLRLFTPFLTTPNFYAHLTGLP